MILINSVKCNNEVILPDSLLGKLQALLMRPNQSVMGLANLGNTCFMNVILQVLSHTHDLRRLILSAPYVSPLKMSSSTSTLDTQLNESISQALEYTNESSSQESISTILPKSNSNELINTPYTRDNSTTANTTSSDEVSDNHSSEKYSEVTITDETIRILKRMWRGNKQYLVPRRYLQCVWFLFPHFSHYAQHDAQEFLHYLLHQFKKEFTDKQLQYRLVVPLSDIFVGSLHSELKCNKCGKLSVREDPFVDISLPIPKVEDENISYLSLFDCFDLFTSSEVINKDEGYFCSKCQTRQACTKRLLIKSTPKVLALHIKRSVAKTTRTRQKQNVQVRFPITNLDIRPYLKEPQRLTQYELYAVVIHQGGHTSGHYLCCIYSSEHDCWFEINDISTRVITMEELSMSNACSLFYRHRAFKAKKAISIEAVLMSDSDSGSQPCSELSIDPFEGFSSDNNNSSLYFESSVAGDSDESDNESDSSNEFHSDDDDNDDNEDTIKLEGDSGFVSEANESNKIKSTLKIKNISNGCSIPNSSSASSSSIIIPQFDNLINDNSSLSKRKLSSDGSNSESVKIRLRCPKKTLTREINSVNSIDSL